MKHIVFLTGAGMSAESGFKTFRGNGGLWEDYPVEQVASHEGWLKDPVLVNNFYNGLRHKLYAAQPNGGHLAIARLEHDYKVTVITQNVDNLHERAGSTHVIHLHGELAKVCSSRDVDDPRYIRTLTADNCEVKPGEKSGDGSLTRPYIVFFGEAVPRLTEAAEAVAEADLFVIIGTSLNVYPAAGLTGYVRRGTPIYLIDPGEPCRTVGAHVTHIRCGATEGMERLCEAINDTTPHDTCAN